MQQLGALYRTAAKFRVIADCDTEPLQGFVCKLRFISNLLYNCANCVERYLAGRRFPPS